MVQGLAFLSKKSWHTKNLSNQKRVWEEEQKQAAEASKTKELARQIQQEREQEELDRISGKKSAMDRGIDWMYQGGTQGELAKQDAERKAEEFLLGKEFVGEGAVQGDFDGGDQKEGINNVLSAAASVPRHEDQEDSKPAALPTAAAAAAAAGFVEPSVHDRNEAFRLRNEDPMWAVSQQARQKEQKREHTKELYERVVGIGGDGSDGSTSFDRKRSRKEKKRHKKKKKKRSSSRRDAGSEDSSNGDDNDNRRNRKRHRKRSRSRSRSRSHSSGPHHRSRNRRDGDRGYDSRSEDDSHYGDRKSRRLEQRDRQKNNRDHQRRYDDDDRKHRQDHHGDRSDRRRRDYDRDRNERPLDDSKIKKQEGYGLKGAPAYSSSTAKRDLGPDPDLLRQKKEAKETERRRTAELRHSRKRSTEEERKKALREMQEDARKREERKIHQVSHGKKDLVEDDTAGGKGSASFLNDISKQTHGIAGNESLSSRVAQNRHTNQRLHDAFM
ncbi:CBF1 interacting co-repressor CIR family protein [Nitzschia inconspicua]|uniref:CBF1 interacting co-repressor CIR family protein n=1 Tax=Nitzschia inconspicua TaxID=303405 RepID=A0A9K3LLV5_9STRA|nr:CBF1 interacting co-repressor CIR family protein [Nitzschia inconspicua]